MEVVKVLFTMVAIPLIASAGEFTLSIGPPIAAGTAAGGVIKKKTSGASFAVRLEECDALERAQISGTAEGLVSGARTSGPVTIAAAGSPGVYMVTLDSFGSNAQPQGVWVVNVTAVCGSAKAGAIVPLSPAGFQREGTKVLPHPATKAEVDAALKTLDK
jgi:hypothetical protein